MLDELKEKETRLRELTAKSQATTELETRVK